MLSYSFNTVKCLRNLNIFVKQQKSCSSVSNVEVLPRAPNTKLELYKKLILLKPDSPENSRVLKISVVGCPNAGKSSLVNMLTKWNVCGVSGKVNTTRTKQTAILTQGNIQLCFIDLPGVIGKYKGMNFKLEKSLIRDPHVGIFESDLILVLMDVTHAGSREELNNEILKLLYFFKDKPSILVLNKIDKASSIMKLFDMSRKLTNGIVGGKISHIDKYANRFRNRSPTYQDLLNDGRLDELQQIHSKTNLLSANLTDLNDTSELHDSPQLKASMDVENIHSENDIQTISEETNSVVSHLSSNLQTSLDETEKGLIEFLNKQLMLNTATKQEVMERRKKWREITTYLDKTRETSWKCFDDVFAVSSATGKGIDRLRTYLLNRAKPGQWYFHSSLITDQDPESTVKMCVWATCLNLLEKEIPYQIMVNVDNCEKSFDGSLHIHVTLKCSNSRQLMTVLGTKGKNISLIADKSRELLEKCFQNDVHLKLVASRLGIPYEHKQRMKAVTDIKQLYANVNN